MSSKAEHYLGDEVEDVYDPAVDDVGCRVGEPLSCTRELRRFFDYENEKPTQAQRLDFQEEES